MHSLFILKLSESFQNNDSQTFANILNSYPISLPSFISDDNSNIFHELSKSRMNEKYVLPYLETLILALSSKLSEDSISILLNSQLVSNEKYSPLHLSILRGKMKLAKRYLELGADPSLKTDQGRNALHLCAETGMLSLFIYVKEKHSLDIETVDFKGFNPLHLAIRERREDMAMLILSLSRDLKLNSKLALEMAVNIGSYKITRHLLMHRQGKSLDMKKLKLKSDDKDIGKLIKKKRNPDRSKKLLMLFNFALISKELYYWVQAYQNFGTTHSSSIVSVESSFRVVTLLLIILLVNVLSVLSPGYEIPNIKTNLYELYEKYIPEYICPYCSVKKHKRTKHCQICKKCVRDHDHHCKWLNNCIGSNNIKHFGGFIFLFLINLIFNLVLYSIELYLKTSIIIEGILRVDYLHILFLYGFIANLVSLTILIPALFKWITRMRKNKIGKYQVGKDPLLQNADYMKGFRDLENEATSDTASMLIKETLDSNSESASSSTFVSQFFSNRSQ